MNFLESLKIPELGSAEFQDQFNDFCTAIKNNFERLISVQYTKGNDGNSVYAHSYLIDDDLESTDHLSSLSISMINGIFGLNLDGTESVSEVSDLVDSAAPRFEGDVFQNASAMKELLVPTTTGIQLELFIDEHEGKAYLANPFIFIDGRIADLNKYMLSHSNIDDTYKHFHDYSTVIYGKGVYDANNGSHVKDSPETWNWSIVRSDLVPKLYFDEDVHEFCWEVNNQRTGITAQGIKGDSGVSANIHMARGNRGQGGEAGVITVEEIQYIDSTGHVLWKPIIHDTVSDSDTGETSYTHSIRPSDNPNDWVYINPEDFMLVFYNRLDETATSTNIAYPWAFFGKPTITDTSVVIYPEANYKNDIIDAIANQSFRSWMNRISISVHENHPGLRGIFIPASDNIDAGNLHMLYIENQLDNANSGFNRLRISPVLYEQSKQGVIAPIIHHIGDLTVDYNTRVQGNVTVDKDLVVNHDATIQHDLTVNNDTHIGGNLSVGGALTSTGKPFASISDTRPAAICKFVDTSCVLYRIPTKTSTNPLEQRRPTPYNITYQVKLSTKLNIKMGKLTDVNTGLLTYNSQSNPTPIMGGQGCQGSINDALHILHGALGGSSRGVVTPSTSSTTLSRQDHTFGGCQGMWYDDASASNNGLVETIQDPTIDSQTNTIRNSPKLYDVVEYEIPIYLAKETTTDISVHRFEHRWPFSTPVGSQGWPKTWNTQGIQGSVLMYKQGTQQAAYTTYSTQGSSFTNSFVDYLTQGVGSNSSFRDINVMVGSNLRLSNNTNQSEALTYVTWSNVTGIQSHNEYVQGALDTLKNRVSGGALNNPNNPFMVRGSFDYLGTTVQYYIDFFIYIREVMDDLAAVLIDDVQYPYYQVTAPKTVRTSITITPVGYLEFEKEGKIFKTPIYGALSVNDKHPRTTKSKMSDASAWTRNFGNVVTSGTGSLIIGGGGTTGTSGSGSLNVG